MGHVIKAKKHLLLKQNTETEDISIVELNISDFHKVVILRTKFTKTLKKNLSSVNYLINQNCSLHVFD